MECQLNYQFDCSKKELSHPLLLKEPLIVSSLTLRLLSMLQVVQLILNGFVTLDSTTVFIYRTS